MNVSLRKPNKQAKYFPNCKESLVVTSQLKHSSKKSMRVSESKTKCFLLTKILNILFLPFYQDPLELTPSLGCKRYKNLAHL